MKTLASPPPDPPAGPAGSRPLDPGSRGPRPAGPRVPHPRPLGSDAAPFPAASFPVASFSVVPHQGASFAVAPAKINLALEVVGRRADGFHDLRSVFAPLVLADDLRVSVGAGGSAAATGGPVGAGSDGGSYAHDRLTVSGAPDVPAADNLVLRAALLLRAEAGRPLPPLAFRLRKRIPAAAGLGGGSSDALAALDLAASAWGLRLPRRRRLDLAAALGSDVPFFALGGWALVRGRGERLVHLPPPRGGRVGVLLVVPSARLSTRDVFKAFDAGRGARPSGTAATGAVTHPGGSALLAALLRRGGSAAEVSDARPANDLLDAAAALLPGLDHLRRQVGDMLGRPVHLSGSGPTLFVLYPSPRDARRAARQILAAAAAGTLRPPGGTLQAIATATEGEDA